MYFVCIGIISIICIVYNFELQNQQILLPDLQYVYILLCYKDRNKYCIPCEIITFLFNLWPPSAVLWTKILIVPSLSELMRFSCYCAGELCVLLTSEQWLHELSSLLILLFVFLCLPSLLYIQSENLQFSWMKGEYKE